MQLVLFESKDISRFEIAPGNACVQRTPFHIDLGTKHGAGSAKLLLPEMRPLHCLQTLARLSVFFPPPGNTYNIYSDQLFN